METLKLNTPLLDLEGNDVEPKTTLALALGNTLLQAVQKNEGDILKYFDWAGQLAKAGEIKLDAGDAVALKKFIIDHDGLYVITKAPILKAMADLKF